MSLTGEDTLRPFEVNGNRVGPDIIANELIVQYDDSGFDGPRFGVVHPDRADLFNTGRNFAQPDLPAKARFTPGLICRTTLSVRFCLNLRPDDVA